MASERGHLSERSGARLFGRSGASAVPQRQQPACTTLSQVLGRKRNGTIQFNDKRTLVHQPSFLVAARPHACKVQIYRVESALQRTADGGRKFVSSRRGCIQPLALFPRNHHACLPLPAVPAKHPSCSCMRIPSMIQPPICHHYFLPDPLLPSFLPAGPSIPSPAGRPQPQDMR